MNKIVILLLLSNLCLLPRALAITDVLPGCHLEVTSKKNPGLVRATGSRNHPAIIKIKAQKANLELPKDMPVTEIREDTAVFLSGPAETITVVPKIYANKSLEEEINRHIFINGPIYLLILVGYYVTR